EATAMFDESIGFKVVVGFVENNSKEPFIFSYEHRIIFDSANPCGDYPPSTRFLAFVELFGKWPMLKHKDGLRETIELDWLESQLLEICRPLLEKLKSQGEEVQFDEIASELESLMINVRGRQKRNKAEDEGTIHPKGTIRLMEEAESVSSGQGDVRERPRNKKKTGFSITYAEMDESRIGKVTVTNSRTFVQLNVSHPCIQAYRANR